MDVAGVVFEIDASKAEQGARRATSALDALERRTDAFVQKIAALQKQVASALSFPGIKTGGGTGSGTGAATSGASALGNAQRKAADEALRHAQALARLQQAQGSTAQGVRTLETALRGSTASMRQMLSAQTQLARLQSSQSFTRYAGTIREAGESIQQAGFALLGLTTGLIAVGAASVKSAFGIDANINTLKAFLGSTEAAENRFRDLVKLSSATPGLTTGLAAQLDVQLRVAGATEQAINRVLPAIGRLNAVAPLGDSQRFASNLVQLVTGEFERPDLKELVQNSPLGGQIIKEIFKVDSAIDGKAIRESAKKLGITTVDAFFEAFGKAAEQNKSLAGITESLQTRFAKLVDRVTVALRPLGLAIVDALGPLVEKAVPIIERLGKAFSDLPSGAKQAIIVFGAIVAAIGPAVIALGAFLQTAGAIGNLVGVFSALSGAATGAGAVMTAALGPVGVVLGVLAVAAAAFGVAWATNFGGVRDVTREAVTFVIEQFRLARAAFNGVGADLAVLRGQFETFSALATPIVRIFWESFRSEAARSIAITIGVVASGMREINRQIAIAQSALSSLAEFGGRAFGGIRGLGGIFAPNPRREGRGLDGEEVTRADFAAAEDAQRFAKATGGKVAGSGKTGGGARSASRTRDLTEAQKLTKELTAVNREIALLQNVNGREFGLKLKVDDARDFRADLEKIVELRRELNEPIRAALPATASGADREIERLTALKTALDLLRKADPVELFKDTKAAEINRELEAFARLAEEINSKLPETESLTLAESLATGKLAEEFAKLNPLLREQIRNQAALADGLIATANAAKEFADLQDLLDSKREASRQLTAAETLEIQLQQKAFEDLGAEQVAALRKQADAVDAQNVFGRQVEEARRQFAQLNEIVVNLFEDLFERGPKAFFENVLSTVKRSLSRIASELIASPITGLLSRLFNSGGRSATGGGGNPLGFLGIGGNSGGSSFLTGGFAGGNPAGAILGGGGGSSQGLGGIFQSGGSGGGLSGLLRKIPGIGRLFGGASGVTRTGNIGSLPGVTRFPAQLSAQPGALAGAAVPGLGASLGAGGLLAGGGLLGSFAGGKSPTGRLLGGLGGTLLGGVAGASGLFGGGVASALPAFFTNPITAVIGGALIGGALLARFLGGGVLKSLRKLIKGEYALDVKSDKTLESVKAIGEQRYGKKEFRRHQIETVKLAEVRELLAQYADRTGQRGNGKLFATGRLQDPFDAGNQFKVRRALGGGVTAGNSYLIHDAGKPEVFMSGQAGNIFPSIENFAGQVARAMADRQAPSSAPTVANPASGGLDQMILGAIVANTQALNRLQAVPPGHVVQQGLATNPDLATRAVAHSFQRRSEASTMIRDNVNRR